MEFAYSIRGVLTILEEIAYNEAIGRFAELNRQIGQQEGEGISVSRMKKPNARNTAIRVAVSNDEREAMEKEAQRRETSVSQIAYEMLQRGSLTSLVDRHFADRSATLPK